MEILQQQILPIILMVMAVVFFGMGFLGTFKKKPFMASSKWQAVAMIVALSPLFLTMLVFAMGSDEISAVLVLALWVAGGLIMATLIRKLMVVKGFMAFGINDESFRHVLLTTLDELGISYQEQLTRLMLPNHNMQLRITILSRSGTGHISPGGDVKQEVFNKIIQTMQHKLATGPYTLNKRGYATHMLVGAVLLALAFVI